MNLRSSLGYPLMAFAVGLPLTACGDSGTASPISTDTSTTATQTSTVTGATTTGTTTTPTSATGGATGADTSEPAASATGELSGSGPVGSESETMTPPPPCEIPGFAVFTRSDSTAAWDDNDFSDVVIDSTGCPPAVFVDVTWPHEADWFNADPSEANREQTHFTLDSGGGDLTNKEVTATVELADDQRGPNATAGGYLVSIVSVSTFDRITIVEPVVPADAGSLDAGSVDTGLVVDGGAGDGAVPPPQTITETGYTEAESALEDRVLLRHVGDRATIRFKLPAKTEAEDSYDPARAIKVNLRFYNVFTSSDPVATPVDAGVIDAAVTMPVGTEGDAGVAAFLDASITETVELGPTPYDYLTSRFAITKFTITDVAP